MSTSTLNCLNWMNTQSDQTPCTTAQTVGSICISSYTVLVANFLENDYIPNATTANDCTCSWAIYNLLSACSYCVGQDQYTSWSSWISNCGSYVSTTSYLIPGVNISGGIPFWATQYPPNWTNGTFNVIQAENMAVEDQPDVTSVPSTSTGTSSPGSSAPVGAIVGGVIGGITIIVIGSLIAFWAIRRQRLQKTHTEVRSLIPSQSIIGPSFWSGTPVQPTPSRHAYGPPAFVSSYPMSSGHSTTSLALTSLPSPVSSGFSPKAPSAVLPLGDAAEVITPFLATPSRHRTTRSNASSSSAGGKPAEARSERVMTPPGQRARLNPPPYSDSAEPESPRESTSQGRRLSSTIRQKRRKGSVSGATTYSVHSRTSTRESVQAQMEQSRSRVAALGMGPGAEGVMSADGGSNAGAKHGRRAGRPPVV